MSGHPEYTTIELGGLTVGLVVARPGQDIAAALPAAGAPADLLSRSEAEIHEAFGFEPRRRDWLAGRLAAKLVLLGYLDEPGLEPAGVEILPEESRLPLAYRVLEDGRSRKLPVSVSISHRGGAAAAAVIPLEAGCVGVDIEIMEPRSEALAEDNFTQGERALMRFLPTEAAEWAIAIIWSLKEAALKAAGLGLSVPATDAEVVELDVEGSRASVRLAGEAAEGEPRLAGAWIRLEPPLIVTVAVVDSDGM